MADYSLQKSCARRLIRDMIGTVSPEGGFKVMVVDHLAMRIMSSCLKMHMINDANVTHVENLALAREPIPSLECIYFVAPTQVRLPAVEGGGGGVWGGCRRLVFGDWPWGKRGAALT